MQRKATQRNATQYNAIQCNTIPYNTIQYNTIKYSTVQYHTINTIQYKGTAQKILSVDDLAGALEVQGRFVATRRQLFARIRH